MQANEHPRTDTLVTFRMNSVNVFLLSQTCIIWDTSPVLIFVLSLQFKNVQTIIVALLDISFNNFTEILPTLKHHSYLEAFEFLLMLACIDGLGSMYGSVSLSENMNDAGLAFSPDV